MEGMEMKKMSAISTHVRMQMSELTCEELSALQKQAEYWLRSRQTKTAGRVAAMQVLSAIRLERDIREAQELTGKLWLYWGLQAEELAV
jgi:hypothetical protein